MTCKTCGGDAKDSAFCAACLAGPNPYAGVADQPVRLTGLSPQYDMRQIFAIDPALPDLPTKSELQGWRSRREV